MVCNVLLIFFITLTRITVISATTQAATNPWSQPEEISPSLVAHAAPRLLTDRYGRLHAFWVAGTALDAPPGDNQAIFYTLNNDAHWGVPNDVLARPGAIRGMSVVLDAAERFHLLLIDQNNGALLYSTAEMWDAMYPRAWLAPQQVVSARVSGVTLITHDEQLLAAYTLWEEPFEVYFIRANTDGVSWSEPVQVSNILGNWYETALGVSLARGADGDLYLAWGQYVLPEGYPPQRIMFSRSEDGGQTWSEAVQLSEGAYGLPMILAGPDNTLYVTYNGAAGTSGRYLLYSMDAGLHWSERITIAPVIGGLTGGTMALDCAGTLHYASAADEGVGGSGINGVAYTQWRDGRWDPVRNIAGIAPGTDERTRQGYEPVMAIAQCNQIHVIYLGASHGYVYHTTAQASAPAIEPVPLASPTPSPTATPITSAPPDPESTIPTPALSFERTYTDSAQTSNLEPIIFGGLAALLVANVALFVGWRERKRR